MRCLKEEIYGIVDNMDKTEDINVLSKMIVEAATREKDPAAVALGRKGGLKGGKARAQKLTPEERKSIAQKGAKARWEKKD